MEMAEDGVRTRARVLAMKTASSGTVKRRKVGGGGLRFSPSSIKLRSRRRRRVGVTPENSVSSTASLNSRRRSAANYLCSSPSSDHLSASCCSSNGSSELEKEISKFADLEEESDEFKTSTYNFEFRARERRREKTPSSDLREESGEMESTARPFETSFQSRSSSEKMMMPSDSELEEFFAVAEKDLQKRFTEKYNFDIVKGEPTEGRYEWVRIKP